MGWFDEQIRQRMESDQSLLEDSLLSMAGVVLDKWTADRMEDRRLITREALDEILKYYHMKPVEIPAEIQSPEEQLEYVLQPSGIMVRPVRLEKDWQKDAFGPMLGLLKESGATVALLPGTLSGYYFRDPATGKRTRITRKNASLFSRDAMCFYMPLPMKKLGIPDLLRYMKNSISIGDLVLIALAALAVTLLGMLEPRVYSLVTGSVLQGRKLFMMYGLAGFLIGSTFAAQLMNVVRGLLMNRINTKTSLAVQSSVMIRILSLPAAFFRRFSSGELSNRAESVSSLCSMILNSIVSLGLSSLLSLLYVTEIFHYAPALVVPSLLILLATMTVSVTASLWQIRITRQKMQHGAKEAGMSYAMLDGIQKIRLSGAEKRVFARWGRMYAAGARLEYAPPTFLKVNPVITTGISLVGTVALYYLAIRSGVSESQYYSFSAAYGRVMAAFQALAGIALSVAAVKPVLEMAEPILQAEPEVSAGKKAISQLSGAIELSHVSFRYEEGTPYVLEDLSLKIQAGEYVAIVGRTGCGKSTLIRLLLGFEKPEKGAVYYDHCDLSTLDPRSVRKHLGVVIQNGQLFPGDIFSNITISAPQCGMDGAWAAAETAGIADDIRAMPMGMQTMISEGQGGISGGQKQRLLIARAIAPQPRILIFDEATSALDNQTQKQVSQALDRLKCTRIVIAHRLSTIQQCDRILVLSQGRISEEGTYQELIERGGEFADLVARQRLDTDA